MEKIVKALYPIGDVSEITGVNPVTLRAWQRRYGLIKPQRTPKGHRLYSETDIESIRKILAWLDKGVAIRNVKALLASPGTEATTRKPLPESEQMLDALASLDTDKAQSILSTCIREYPFNSFKKQFFDVIESAVRSEGRPHRGLQYTLWRTLIIENLASIVNHQRSRNNKVRWLIRCGQRGHTLAWLSAWEMSCKGYKVNVLDGIQEGLSPFVDLINANGRTKVIVVGEEKLKPAIIKELQRLPQKPLLLGSIATIHANDFVEG
jgi:DNA-binding transcriptional MerR regulator